MIWSVTSLGDTGLLLPVSLLVLICLLAQRQFGAAFAWASAMTACGVLTFAAKLGFHLCGDEIAALDIRSPSGHTSVSTTLYGSLGVLVAGGRPPWQKALALGAAAALAVAVGVSRLLLEVHTIEEVLLGYLIGVICVALFTLLFVRAGSPRIGLLWPAAGFAVALAVLGGIRVNFEHEIAGLSRLLGTAIDVCG